MRKVGSGFAGAAENIEGLMMFEDEVEDVTIITGCDEVVDVTCKFLVEATS